MKFFNKKSLAIAGIATAALAASGAANAITLTYDTVVTSPAPTTGTAPWLTATITNNTTLGGVDIVLSSSVSSPEFITAIFFSLSGGSPVLTNPTTTDPALSQQRCNGASPAGTGPWQLCVAFSSSNDFRFDELEESPFTFHIAGVTESQFVLNGRGLYSVAHVQGIPTNCSGWIGANAPGATDNPGVPVEGCGGTSVPEPGTLALLGLGLLGVGLTRRRLT